MAAVNIKQEVHRVSPGQSSMAADSVDGMDKIGEKSFSALQGLIMAEDRRTKEKEVSCLQNVRKFWNNLLAEISVLNNKVRPGPKVIKLFL